MTDIAKSHVSVSAQVHPSERPLRRFLIANRASLGSLVIFVLMMLTFFIANPVVFSNWGLYLAVMTTLPVALFLVAPLVFVVTSGEIDLSFPAVMGLAALAFAVVVQAGYDPFLAMAAAIAFGTLLGFGIGALVVYGGLSSLVATLGMNFMLRGVILIVTSSKSIAMPELANSLAFKIFSGKVMGIPLQMVWALLFVAFCALLYNRHRFGAHVHVVGDNPDSANEMGINVKWTRVKVFGLMGLGAALAGIFSTMINFTWWPTSGDGYLLPVIASVFVGGTPPWGGIGTVVGGAIGALTVSFIQTGVVGVGLSGFYVQFFYGLIIILSLLGHRWNQIRYR
jgi:ribose/xylose/arabinose/galactoside ABC-type transport system permease subunit